MKIKDLAKELRIDKKFIHRELTKAGFFVSPTASQIDDKLGHTIIARFQARRQPQAKAEDPLAARRGEKIALPPTMTVKVFAERVKLAIPLVMKELMKNGIFANLNETIDYDTAAIIVEDMGFVPVKGDEESEKLTSVQLRGILAQEAQDDPKKSKIRPPIVTIMGHVDHGKTTLLDTIRKENVAAGESGGITQRIGAYQVHPKKGRKQLITFLDTPGHEAFSAMRARGANVTDIAVLVVAADDGVRPQTEEACKLAQSAKVPIIVAINKIDKPDANIDRIKTELGEKLGLVPEEWGGDIMMIPISAKKGTGIEKLLESILLVAEVQKFQANPSARAFGTVIESHLDNKIGPLVTVVVQSGTLRVGDEILVGAHLGKVKALWDYQMKDLKEAVLSQPVRVLGLTQVPDAGDVLQVVEDKREAKDLSKRLQSHERLKKIAKSKYVQVRKFGTDTTSGGAAAAAASAGVASQGQKPGAAAAFNAAAGGTIPEYVIVLKADVKGSLEAIEQSVEGLKSEHVRIRILDASTGDITESDVMLARASHAVILGFNVKKTPIAGTLAKKDKIDIQVFSIIYELFDYVKKGASALLPALTERRKLGKMKVLKIFKTSRGEMIAGGSIISGLVRKGAVADVLRGLGEERVGTGRIAQLQHNRAAADEVAKGNECGILFSGSFRLKEGDILEVFEEVDVKRTL